MSLTQVLVRLSECSMKCERHRFDLATEAEDGARARSNSEARHGLTSETLSQIEHELNLQ